MSPDQKAGTCRTCLYFGDDADMLERQLVGITILSSAWGDTRGDQGMCALHRQFAAPDLSCPSFTARNAESTAPGS